MPGLICVAMAIALSDSFRGWAVASSVAAASTEKPSRVVLWHKLIDAAIPVCKNAVTAAVRLCCAKALQIGAATAWQRCTTCRELL